MPRNHTPLKVFDGHNDVLLALYLPDGKPRSFFESSDHGHLDLPRAQKGGFVGGFFAVWVSPDPTSRKPDLRKPAGDDEMPSALPPVLISCRSLAITGGSYE